MSHDGDDTAPLLDEEQGISLDQLGGGPHLRASPDAWTELTNGQKSRSRHQHIIRPWFASAQSYPLRLLNAIAPTPTRKIALLALSLFIWLALFSLLVGFSNASTSIAGLGPPRRLSDTSSLWPRDGISCGAGGARCFPPVEKSHPFRCPPGCSGTKVWEPAYVGSEFAQYRTWVIGGQNASDPISAYRGDSFICAAAVHAGVIDDRTGGCGILTSVGERSHFPSINQNGVPSIGFNASFPSSFLLSKVDQPTFQCYNQPWPTLTVSVLTTLGISIYTTSASIFFYSTFVITFFQTALVSDPPDPEDFLAVVQLALSRFLPAFFVAFAIYRYCVATSLNNLNAPIEKSLLWLGACWFGALENLTLDRLPLQRLTPRDLSEPGAIIVLVVAVLFIVAAAAGQAWVF